MLLLDSTLLIGLRKELGKAHQPLHRWLACYRSERLAHSVVARGEVLEGEADTRAAHAWLNQFGRPLPVTAQTATIMAQTQRARQLKGKRMGENDAWHAATAIEQGASLVTHEKSFAGTPRLSVTWHPRL